ncbi:ABC transporter substrate-binding protein [Paenibacillus selenitireducens]|uniref:ABC transporter substrate-binding protein n=1 Tax=Paenibacillus selenitireducens TaxID=1324314 RepID=A0A1T2X1L7_9BACL|nr:extracellular solute-binding protein [Paenibacillus selenitireducens]OPA73737.1 ABC transporter substrate-binding protein [Paenibacillus selenitireducens]
MKKRLFMGLMCMLLAATAACGAGGSGNDAKKEKPKSNEGKTVVTFSVKYSDAFYEATEKKFEQKYPDIDLQIVPFIQKDEEWGEGDFEKYIKTTNSSILSGKGADIIEMSDLPVSKYVNKKLLVDMNDMLEQDPSLNKSDLNTNILDAMKLNGGLYTIPSAFYVGTFIGDGDILEKTVKVDEKNWDWKQFEDISRKFMQTANLSGDRYALANYPPEQFLQILVQNNNADFIDRENRKAKFDSPLFVQTMQQIQKMYDERIITANAAKQSNQLFGSTYLFSPLDVVQGAFNFYSNPKLLPTPHSEGETEGTTFLVPNQLGIQANSPVKEEAWKFIAFLMSEEAQSLQEREGFSLLKSVNEKLLNETQNQVKNGEYKLSTGAAIPITERHFAELKQLIESANRFAKTDDKVLSIIVEESKSFFSGQKSADEVAKLIQNRATTYLNE